MDDSALGKIQSSTMCPCCGFLCLSSRQYSVSWQCWRESQCGGRMVHFHSMKAAENWLMSCFEIQSYISSCKDLFKLYWKEKLTIIKIINLIFQKYWCFVRSRHRYVVDICSSKRFFFWSVYSKVTWNLGIIGRVPLGICHSIAVCYGESSGTQHSGCSTIPSRGYPHWLRYTGGRGSTTCGRKPWRINALRRSDISVTINEIYTHSFYLPKTYL